MSDGCEQTLATLSPITATDDEIRAALEEASVPALMTALVHLTGDIEGLRTDIRPDPNAPPIEVVPIYRQNVTSPHKPTGFQIVSPGLDGIYGYFGIFDPAQPEDLGLANGGLSEFDFDNITNCTASIIVNLTVDCS